jgi:hypothetical protein
MEGRGGVGGAERGAGLAVRAPAGEVVGLIRRAGGGKGGGEGGGEGGMRICVVPPDQGT